VTSGFYVAALVLVFIAYDERLVHHVSGSTTYGRISFKNVLAFENFVLLMAVLFGLQFIERSFGPVLPLYVAQLGTPVDHVPLMAGILFSIGAIAGALGNQLCGRLLRLASARTVIAGSAAFGALGALLYLSAPKPAWLFTAAPVFGLAMGIATTAAYTVASSVMPSAARGAGFGLLTTASLTGVALSPIINGFLGATAIRAVFLLDFFGLVAVAIAVSRLMAISALGEPTTPRIEEL
jgi:MFS family permease